MENQNIEQVKTETNNAAPTDGIMVAPVPETSAPVQEPAAETPVEEAPVTSEPVAEPTVAEPQPVVIPKGEKPKSNKKKPNPILIILALVILAGAGYYEYVHFVKPIINDMEASANNTTEGNTKTNTEEKNESSDEIDGEVLVEDETIGKVVAANKKIVSTKDTDGSKDYTYDLYLGNKLLVANLEYHENDGYNSDGRIMAKKIGILKDSETAAKYFAFTVYDAPTKYAKIKLFIIDKEGNIVFQRESQTVDIVPIKETGESVTPTTYKIDETTNTMYYYDIPTYGTGMVVYAKAVQISFGKSVVTDYKTYNNDADTNENTDTQNGTAGLYDKDGNLLVSWDDLVNKYGLDIEKDYLNEFSSREEKSASSIFAKNNFTGKLVLPNTITKIGSYAFAYCNGLLEVVIPDSVTVIGSGAFTGCENLEKAILPKNLTDLGAAAFNGCNKLSDIGSVPTGISVIYDLTFSGCRLTNITIPGNVKRIGYSAFNYCTNLTTVTVQEGVEIIGDSAFANCSNLSSVTIPESVTSIVPGAFRNTKVSDDVYSLNN